MKRFLTLLLCLTLPFWEIRSCIPCSPWMPSFPWMI